MLRGSKFRLFLAGLTAAALIGGVMAADPADAGKKKKKRAKAKSSKVVQVSKGGKAKAGNGGHGGKGGNSGNVHNTGNVGGGGPVITPGQASCAETALAAFVGQNPTGDDVLDALVPSCIPTRNLAANTLQGCIQSAGTLTQAEINACVDDIPVSTTPGSGAGGSVFSGDGGNGAAGGTGGNATGGTGGNNTNSSSTTVNSDDHSISAG